MKRYNSNGFICYNINHNNTIILTRFGELMFPGLAETLQIHSNGQQAIYHEKNK